MKTIGVFFGSRSTEHDISIITAQLIISGLKALDYKVVPVYLNKKGEWLIDESLGELKTFTDGKLDSAKEAKFAKYVLDLEESHGKLVFAKKGLGGGKVTIDLAFPAFHGPYGEDGTIQGLFEMFDVPYVGCGVMASAVAMDKAAAKQIWGASGIPTVKDVVFETIDWAERKAEVLAQAKKLKLPVFVKPVHLGSSIGISKVADFKDLEEKIELALYYDTKVLAEEGVQDLMDVTCCLLGNEQVRASLLQESVFSADLFDFEEKYLNDGGGQFGKSTGGVVIPARLDEKLTKQIQEMAVKAYRALGCTGIGRVDFLVNTKTKEFYANEINPLPGTIYHHLWQKTGVELPELLTTLIKLAEEREASKSKVASTFNSSVLSKLNSQKLKLTGSKIQEKK